MSTTPEYFSQSLLLTLSLIHITPIDHIFYQLQILVYHLVFLITYTSTPQDMLFGLTQINSMSFE